MAWRITNGAGHSVVVVEGCLEQSDSPAFADFLIRAAEEAAASGAELEIDLSGVTEISSHGLRAIASAQRRWRRIVLTCPEGRVREILMISRLDSVFRVQAPQIAFVGPATSAPAQKSREAPAPARAGKASPRRA
jgi:anti-anti-sigma factor